MKSITKEDVAAAISSLAGRGEKVTALSVRQELGNRGSMTTICKHMAAFARDDLSTPPKASTALPDPLRDVFEKAVQTLWQTAADTASADIETIRQASTQRAEALDQRLEDALESIYMLESELDDCKAALTREQRQCEALRKKNAALRAQLALLEKNRTDHLDTLLERVDAALAAMAGQYQSQEPTSSSE